MPRFPLPGAQIHSIHALPFEIVTVPCTDKLDEHTRSCSGDPQTHTHEPCVNTASEAEKFECSPFAAVVILRCRSVEVDLKNEAEIVVQFEGTPVFQLLRTLTEEFHCSLCIFFF